MTGKTHALIGMAAALALRGPGLTLELGLALAAGAVGGLLPDIDSDEAEIRQLTGTNRRSGPVGWLASLLAPSHRGLTHSGLAVLALWLVLVEWLRIPYGAEIVAGYGSHLLADALTIQGVPLLWPLSPRFGLRLIRTGGFMEYLLAVAVGVWAFTTLWPNVAAVVVRW